MSKCTQASLSNTFPYIAHERSKVFLKRPVFLPFISKYRHFIFLAFIVPFVLLSKKIVTAIGVLCAVIWLYLYLSKCRKIMDKVSFVLAHPIPMQLWQTDTALKALNLSEAQQVLVNEGLRDFFLLYLLRPGRAIVMPSKTVNLLWEAFMRNQRSYSYYSQRAFGSDILPYTADIDIEKNIIQYVDNKWMYTYQAACRLHAIPAAQFESMPPRLFAIDALIHAGSTFTAADAIALQQKLAYSYKIWRMNMQEDNIDYSSSANYSDDVEVNNSGDIFSGDSDSDCDWSDSCDGGDGD